MSSKRCSGFTLIEMVIAIVIIGLGLAGVLAAYMTTVTASSDPLIHKQMLSIADEMMEEILLKPFAITGAAPANASTGCGVAASRAAFDDVADYNNYQTTSICGTDGTAVPGLGAYSVRVTVDSAAILGGLAAGDSRRVNVVVTHGAETITLVGWRTNYAAP